MDIAESAVTRLQQLKSEENNPDLKFRVFVQGGGCSGANGELSMHPALMVYSLTIDY